jgi:hypothetical protein
MEKHLIGFGTSEAESGDSGYQRAESSFLVEI